MSEDIEITKSFIGELLEVAEKEIEAAIVEGKPLPTTKLAERIGPKFGMKWPQVYQILNVYITKRPDIMIKNGKFGGIIKIDPKNIPEIKEEI